MTFGNLIRNFSETPLFFTPRLETGEVKKQTGANQKNRDPSRVLLGYETLSGADERGISLDSRAL